MKPKKHKSSEQKRMMNGPTRNITSLDARMAIIAVCKGENAWRNELRKIANNEIEKLQKKKYITETDILIACKIVFEAAGWQVDRNNQVRVPGRSFPKSERGRSDLSCIVPPDGRAVAVEIKASKEEYEEWLRQDDPDIKSHRHALEQKHYGNQVRRRGGYFYCIYSVEQAEKIVEDLK